MLYLACPYSHEDATVREMRFRVVTEVASYLFKHGLLVFSPISHSHPIAYYGTPGDWETWEAFDRRMIAACDEIGVLMLDGWEESTGVRAEIAIARELGKPVTYIRREDGGDRWLQFPVPTA